jgi:hypothetical protein
MSWRQDVRHPNTSLDTQMVYLVDLAGCYSVHLVAKVRTKDGKAERVKGGFAMGKLPSQGRFVASWNTTSI